MVEVAQYLRLVDLLGLTHNAVARTVIGTSYSTVDVVACATGAVLAFWVHRGRERTVDAPPAP